ncbi:cytosine permease [Streptomyces pinistramenti]|uniref:cytosine permease n=1 Tax=Streptomyces pinistramenti TaxID=2884812 RepID=UPI001D074EDC|nr:cytosine permease [Streptomyces pinistramenti]MCB5906370.1 cytosine permease [Streptomyces pinistramenti]
MGRLGLSLLSIVYGVHMVALGLSPWQALVTGTAGYVLSFLLVSLVSVAGARTGAPTMAIGRASFGRQGNKLPTLFSYLSTIGWETVLVALSSLGGSAILARLSPTVFAQADGTTPTTAAQALCFATTAVSVVVVGIFGHALIMKVQKYLTAAITAMTAASVVLLADRIDPAALRHGTPGDAGTFIGGIVFAMTLLGPGWVNCGADYSRYLPRGQQRPGDHRLDDPGRRPVATGTPGLRRPARRERPEARRGRGRRPRGRARRRAAHLVPGAVSAGRHRGLHLRGDHGHLQLRHVAADPGHPRPPPSGGAGGRRPDGGGGWYVLFVSPSFFATFQAFLSVIGVAMAAWTAVFLVEQWHRRHTGFDLAATRTLGWPAVLSLAAATAVGLGLITSADPNIARAVGFLLTESAAHGRLGAMNLGVVVALVAAAVLYAATAPLADRAATEGVR